MLWKTRDENEVLRIAWSDIIERAEGSWIECPACGSDDLQETAPESDGDACYVQMHCLGCSSTWTIRYALDTIVEFSAGPDVKLRKPSGKEVA